MKINERKTIKIYILIIFNTEKLRHIIIKDRTLSARIVIFVRNDLSSQKEAKKDTSRGSAEENNEDSVS